MSNPESLRHFVRDVLGCQCSEKILANVRRIGGELREIAGVPLDLAIDVDGRLLVCVVRADEPHGVTAALAAVFAAGKEKRDREGFNRFRFVVAAAEPEAMREELFAAFRSLSGADDRQHLHVVDVTDVPSA